MNIFELVDLKIEDLKFYKKEYNQESMTDVQFRDFITNMYILKLKSLN